MSRPIVGGSTRQYNQGAEEWYGVYLGTGVMNVLVGSGSHFVVHKELLGRASRPLRIAMEATERSNLPGILRLTEEDPRTFDAALEWLYRDNRLELVDMELSRPQSGPMWQRLKLYCFAVKFEIKDLEKQVELNIRDSYTLNGAMPSVEALYLIYDSTTLPNQLRLFMAASWAHAILYNRSNLGDRELERISVRSDIASDILDAIHEVKRGPLDWCTSEVELAEITRVMGQFVSPRAVSEES